MASAYSVRESLYERRWSERLYVSVCARTNFVYRCEWRHLLKSISAYTVCQLVNTRTVSLSRETKANIAMQCVWLLDPIQPEPLLALILAC